MPPPPKFCGQPGWPPCQIPPQPAVDPATPAASPLAVYAWQCYLAGRSDQQNGVPVGPLPPWLASDSITTAQVKQFQKEQGK